VGAARRAGIRRSASSPGDLVLGAAPSAPDDKRTSESVNERRKTDAHNQQMQYEPWRPAARMREHASAFRRPLRRRLWRGSS